MANVLITGGAGYVGAVVTGAFLGAGHRVVTVQPDSGLKYLAGDVFEAADRDTR